MTYVVGVKFHFFWGKKAPYSVAINKALHDDLVHQSRGDYQIRQANAEFLANNLNHLPEDMDLMTQGQLSEKFAEELQIGRAHV